MVKKEESGKKSTGSGRGGNYEKQVYLARDLFLRYDQDAIIEKFQLESDESYLYIKMLNQNYRISRLTGEIEGNRMVRDGWGESAAENATGREEEDGFYETCMDYNVVMTIYDVLCYSKQRPRLSGEWCSLASLQVTNSPSQELMTRRYAQMYAGRADVLNDACRRLEGERQTVPASADACYKIKLFSFFPVIFQFWDGDDEFEPKIMLLWDRKSLDFMHFETLYYAAGHFLQRLFEITEE